MATEIDPARLGPNADQLGTNDANLLAALTANARGGGWDAGNLAHSAYTQDLVRQGLARGMSQAEALQYGNDAGNAALRSKAIPDRYTKLGEQAIKTSGANGIGRYVVDAEGQTVDNPAWVAAMKDTPATNPFSAFQNANMQANAKLFSPSQRASMATNPFAAFSGVPNRTNPGGSPGIAPNYDPANFPAAGGFAGSPDGLQAFGAPAMVNTTFGALPDRGNQGMTSGAGANYNPANYPDTASPGGDVLTENVDLAGLPVSAMNASVLGAGGTAGAAGGMGTGFRPVKPQNRRTAGQPEYGASPFQGKFRPVKPQGGAGGIGGGAGAAISGSY